MSYYVASGSPKKKHAYEAIASFAPVGVRVGSLNH
jgi:hypothetical protein